MRGEAGACMVAVLALVAMGCHHDEAGAEEKAPPVRTRCVAAARAPIEQTLLLRGRIAPPPGGALSVAAQIPGRIVEVRVKEGDTLKKGAVVATVDDLAPRAAAREADAALARAMSGEAAARTALDRAKAQAASGVGSRAEVDDATARHDAAVSEVEAGRAAVRLASGNLGRVEVRSAFGGVVTKLWRGAGALVDGTAATPIADVASTDAIELVADVTQRELALAREGQRASITLAGDGPLTGAVVARSRALDPATGLGQVRIALDPPAGAPPPLGAFGDARLALGSRDVLAIPRAALRGAIADGAEVVVCKPSDPEAGALAPAATRGGAAAVAQIRKVGTGYRDDAHVEIVSGLTEGERVAVDHVLGLDDGTPLGPSDDREAPAPAGSL